MANRDVGDYAALGAFNVEHVKPVDAWESKGSRSISTKDPFKFMEAYSRRTNRTSIIKFGKKNDHPQFLKDLVELSGMHKSLIDTKANLTMGDDLVFRNEDGQPNEAAYEYLNNLSLIDMREGLSADLCTFGGFAVQLAYVDDVESKEEVGLMRDLRMAHKHDFHEFRLFKPERDDFGIFKPRYGAIHPFWGDSYKHKDMLTLPIWFTQKNKEGKETLESENFELDLDILGIDKDDNEAVTKVQDRYFYYGKTYSNLAKYYPVPDYQTAGTINAIIVDGELILFDVSEIRNDFSIRYIVTFVRKDWSSEDPDREARVRAAERKLVNDQMTGAKNQARATIVRAEPTPEGEPPQSTFQINEVPNTNSAERHTVLEKRKNTYILVGHGVVAPEIAGIPDLSKGGFSSDADRIVDAISNLFFMRLNRFRKVMSKFYLDMLHDKQEFRGVKTVDFVDNIPFRKKIADVILKHAYLIDEIRAMNGNEPLTEEQNETLKKEKGQKEVAIEGEQTSMFNDE